MKLTVREALQITPLKNATILAGAIGLDREVQNVNIVEVPDTVRWMCGGEIMFSSGFAFSGDAEKGCALHLVNYHYNSDTHKIDPLGTLAFRPGFEVSSVKMHAFPENPELTAELKDGELIVKNAGIYTVIEME